MKNTIYFGNIHYQIKLEEEKNKVISKGFMLELIPKLTKKSFLILTLFSLSLSSLFRLYPCIERNGSETICNFY